MAVTDFVYNVLEKISSSKPVYFERDNILYIASDKGFGIISPGLGIGTKDAVDSFTNRSGNNSNEESIFNESDAPFFQAISFGPDTTSFTLEEITKRAEKLSKLTDDGKLRMISHGSGYHSHKFGYAADGTDVWVKDAKTIDRSTYLDRINNAFDKTPSDLAELGKLKDRETIRDAYKRVLIPKLLIMTPYIIVSLPQNGRLNFGTHQPDSWTDQTELSINYEGNNAGSILHSDEIDTMEESPYTINLKLNSHTYKVSDTNTLCNNSQKLMEEISMHLAAVNRNSHFVDGYLVELNEIHNEVCKQDIEWRKAL